MSDDAEPVSDRYAFGANWARFAEGVSAESLRGAREALALHVGNLEGCTFLDVGSGSGLMSAGALSLGAAKVLAFDRDPLSVNTTESLLRRFAPGGAWEAEQGDVLNDDFGSWDVVYSWGVLHHTGNVREALKRAASWVGPGGRFVVAIYARTPMCKFWTAEKKWYSSAPNWQRTWVRWAYSSAKVAAWTIRGTNPVTRWRHYGERGMSFAADADDWLGGYPYESMSMEEIGSVVLPLGFEVEAEFPLRDTWGILGSGCQTIRFRRV